MSIAFVTSRRVQTVVGALLIVVFVPAMASIGLASVLRVNAKGADLLSSSTSKLLAADGSLMANLHGEINRDPVPLSEIPFALRKAVIAIEDRRFHRHGGIDLRGTARALMNTVRGVRQGGSTITQQLVKNVYFHGRPRNVFTKVSEAVAALGLERVSSKDRILESYLNTTYFGRGSYGVQAAARSYFHKDVSKLTLGESAFLAGLIHMPARYDFAATDAPDVQDARRKAAIARRNIVLHIMSDIGFISAPDARNAKASSIDIQPPADRKWRYPYYVDAVLRELGVLRNRGGERPDKRFDLLGSTYVERAQAVYRDGLRIYTALDPRIQDNAERALRAQLPPGVMPKASAALVSMEPRNGFVQALIGGRDYYPKGCDDPNSAVPGCRNAKVNLALGSLAGGSGRQPGSSFKPIVLAAALEEGLSLKQTLNGSPFTYRYDRNDKWKVENYEGSAGGTMSIVDATKRSVNAAYARLEIQFLGDGKGTAGSAKVARMARRLGFNLPTPKELKSRCGDDFNTFGSCSPADNIPAIALGAKEVSPLEMAGAYSTFANDGVYTRPTLITKITDAEGKVLYRAKPERRRAVSAKTARGVSYVLQEVVKGGTGRAASMADRPVAGKTGTSQMWRDAWFAGYVPQLTTVTWIGNPHLVNGPRGPTVESMIPSNGYPKKVTGGSYPTLIWHSAMRPTLDGLPTATFAEPPPSIFGPPKKLKPFEGEEKEEELSDLSQLIRRKMAGERIVVHRQCPPDGGGRGMQVWKEEKRGNETHVWRSRAVC